MFVSKKEYDKLKTAYDALLSDHLELCNKSQQLVNRYLDLKNVFISQFGNDLFTFDKQDAITKSGNVITVKKWKKQTDKHS